jgi:gamma-glutamylaminecyclotransferase
VNKVFVFGTLKKGFPLHDEGLSGASYLGRYRTVEKYPMMVAGRWYAPMMMHEPGVGWQVKGELYEVNDETLEALDALESVHKPGNYRMSVEVEPLEVGEITSAYVYIKGRELATLVHTAYLEDYQDKRFIHPSQWPRDF